MGRTMRKAAISQRLEEPPLLNGHWGILWVVAYHCLVAAGEQRKSLADRRANAFKPPSRL
jgi:hypothetical protein